MTRRALYVLPGLALLAGACGTSPAEEVRAEDRDDGDAAAISDAGSVDYLTAAASETLDQGTGRFEVTMSADGTAADATGAAQVGITGEYDASIPASHVTMDLGGMFDGLLGAGPGAPGGDDSEGTDVDLSFEMIRIGSTSYVRMSFLGALGGILGDDVDLSEQWLASDAGDLGLGQEDLSPLGTMSPTDFLDLIEGAGGTVEDLGTSDVRGVQTAGYAVTVSVAQALEAHGEDTDELRSDLESLGGDEVADLEIPMEIYVDGDGRVRRVTSHLDGAGELGGGSASGSVTMTMDFFDFGADDVVIAAPPDDQVLTDDEMQAMVEEQLGSIDLSDLGDLDLEDLDLGDLRDALHGDDGTN